MSLALALSLLLRLGHAAPGGAERAPIVRVDGADLYAPRSALPSAQVGQQVQVLRAVGAADPATGRPLTDHFAAGTGEVIAVGDKLVHVRVTAELSLRLRPGDLLALAAPAPAAPLPLTAAPPAAPSAPDAAPPAPVAAAPPPRSGAPDPEAEDLRHTFVGASRLQPRQAVLVWEAWKTRWPASAQRPAVDVEIERLRMLADGVRPAPAPVHTAVSPADGVAGAPIPVVLSLRGDGPAGAANLHFRRPTEEVYRIVPMAPYGSRAMRAEIPAEAVAAPGMEWFVEHQAPGAAPVAVQHKAEAPAMVDVAPPPPAPERAQRSEAQVTFEYVDFYTGTRSDYYLHGEADFLYRVPQQPLYSVRFGAGSYRGRGAPTDSLDAVPKDEARSRSRPVGYNFGYSELEFRPLPALGLIVRGLVGVDYDGLATGAEGRLRLGREDGTNLDVGAARVGDIGNRYALRLGWNTIERLPMAAAVELTDLPGLARQDGSTIDDYGVRLITDARYAFSERLQLGGRVGYQLRNIDHAGFSGGVQAVLSW